MALAHFEITGTTIEWRGPAPFVFLPLPADVAAIIHEDAAQWTYGWGVIPCSAVIRGTTFTTSLFPREGGYLLPIKVAVQRAAGVGIGEHVAAALTLGR